MKLLKTVTFSLLSLFFAMNFSQCSSAKKLQEKTPIKLGEVYFQSWVAGIQGGGSGINVVIPVAGTSGRNIVLDSVYFRGKTAKLEPKADNSIYVGRFSTPFNQQKDIVMTTEPNGEYGNTTPSNSEDFPFQLKEDDCVVSYKDNNQIKYYKIKNITEKARENYPSAPPNERKPLD